MSRYVLPHIARMAGYVPGEQPQGGGFIKLNTNENPYPPSPRVKQALVGRGDRPAPALSRSRGDRVPPGRGRLHGVEPDMILAGNGSDDLLTIITRAFVGPGDLAAYPTPSYLLYSTLIRLQDGREHVVPFTADWTLDADRFVQPGPEAGLPGQSQQPLRDRRSRGGRSPSWPARSPARWSSTRPTPTSPDEHCIPLVHDHPNVIVTRSFSKGYSLAGIRLGYLVARPEIVEQLIKVKDSYNCDALSLAAGVAALEDQDYLARPGRGSWPPGRRLTGALRDAGLHGPRQPGQLRLGDRRAARRRDLRRGSRTQQILVRLMRYPGYPAGLRISVGTDAEIDRLLEVLRSLV